MSGNKNTVMGQRLVEAPDRLWRSLPSRQEDTGAPRVVLWDEGQAPPGKCTGVSLPAFTL